jgi:hypothetical protein
MKKLSPGPFMAQKIGGLSAFYLAAAYILAMPYFLILVDYQGAGDPAAKAALVFRHHASLTTMYLVTYVVFGIVLATLSLTIHARLKAAAPAASRFAACVGIIWACLLIASGTVFNAGIQALVDLYPTEPERAIWMWQGIEAVSKGLGGAGGEILGGLWVLTLSAIGLRSGTMPKALNILGMLLGATGLVSVIPALRSAAMVFGLMQIVWFVWAGIVLFRGPGTVKERAAA